MKIKKVFVPYRGTKFLSRLTGTLRELPGLFSSPTGELSFYRKDSSVIKALADMVFVPYRGTKFLSLRTCFAMTKPTTVFVPYRGTKFLSSLDWGGVKDLISFRPLPGN